MSTRPPVIAEGAPDVAIDPGSHVRRQGEGVSVLVLELPGRENHSVVDALVSIGASVTLVGSLADAMRCCLADPTLILVAYVADDDWRDALTAIAARIPTLAIVARADDDKALRAVRSALGLTKCRVCSATATAPQIVAHVLRHARKR
jgi:hypothetical protein